jgi:hypothetical protein
MLQLVAVVAARLQLEFAGATIDERRCYQRRVLMLPSVVDLLLARVGMLQSSSGDSGGRRSSGRGLGAATVLPR